VLAGGNGKPPAGQKPPEPEESVVVSLRILAELTFPHGSCSGAGGVAASDDALLDLALPLFETEDVRSALPAAVEAFKAGLPRPGFAFKGR